MVALTGFILLTSGCATPPEPVAKDESPEHCLAIWNPDGEGARFSMQHHEAARLAPGMFLNLSRSDEHRIAFGECSAVTHPEWSQLLANKCPPWDATAGHARTCKVALTASPWGNGTLDLVAYEY